MGRRPIFFRLFRQPVLLVGCLFFFFSAVSKAEDPYRYYSWTVTYGTIWPLGVPQQGILINGQFPGPQLDVVTNDNIIIDVTNKLDEPFLITWQGIKQRKNSWQDGVLGTNCPIPPGTNYTYTLQAKDQIGTFTYFPSTAFHRAAGGFGALNVHQRSVISIPYPKPDGGEFTLLVGDWYKASHQALRQSLDSGAVPLASPDGLLINGKGYTTFTGDAGKTYMFRVSNVGLSTSINFRIQGHKMTLVEVEGAHTIQNDYDSLDIHVGQSVAVLVTLNQPWKDYYVVASTRFTGPTNTLTATGVLHYSNVNSPVTGPFPGGPTDEVDFSVQQARSIRLNLTANAARPNPQGSFHYGNISVTRTFVFASAPALVAGKQRYAVNGVSFAHPETPLKLADNFNIGGVINWDGISSSPSASSGGSAWLGAPAVKLNLHDFVEIVFQNTEPTIQSWHLDGYSFWVVAYGDGQWTAAARSAYNLVDAVSRYTVQVYPNGWSAVLVSLDNQGMWNLRSAMWARQYLGQQLYLRVWTSEKSLQNEYDIPTNALRCGKAVGLR